MMFGCGETIEQRMNHFDIVRQIQEDTGGFTAFIPWAFQRENTSLGRFVKEEATAVEYLKTLAISRIYLENILNIQSSWVTPGLKTCQIGLRFGGNDVGSIMIEENVVSAAGAHHRATRRGTAPADSRCGVYSEAARYVVPDVFLELSAFLRARLVVSVRLSRAWQIYQMAALSDEVEQVPEDDRIAMLLAESSLAKDWLTPEEDEAWAHL